MALAIADGSIVLVNGANAALVAASLVKASPERRRLAEVKGEQAAESEKNVAFKHCGSPV
jgi:hypothetical protein